jgi:hypothetical protein
MTAQIRSSLQVQNGSQNYQSQPTAFTSTQTLSIGPTPGTVKVTHAGTDIVLTALTTPGLVRIANLDQTNHVDWGIRDTVSGTFYILGRLNSAQDNNGGVANPTGQSDTFVFRFSPLMFQDETGSGSTGSGSTVFHMKAQQANPVYVLVEAFNA